ncbi:hypothetical protein ICL16_07920 [Iningainema sp. BLCCT55]|uniref:Uncharacterized protein n=1 Tax=Iningainema tapete BLCC-T55 TaxID=2748662 RepID=A0A8J6XH37_9CYAN|nr:hypothetical protein [Iningainema tapete BLCC-T55]
MENHACRAPGHQPPPRPTYPTVKKHASKKAKPEESLQYCRLHCCLVSAKNLMIQLDSVSNLKLSRFVLPMSVNCRSKPD